MGIMCLLDGRSRVGGEYQQGIEQRIELGNGVTEGDGTPLSSDQYPPMRITRIHSEEDLLGAPAPVTSSIIAPTPTQQWNSLESIIPIINPYYQSIQIFKWISNLFHHINSKMFSLFIFINPFSMVPHHLLPLLLLLPLLTLGALCPLGQTQVNGQCSDVQFIQGCYTYLGRNKCGECEFNYQLIGDSCDYQESDKSKCCLSYGADGACNKCERGLFLRNGGCFQSNLVGCVEKSFETCLNCASGFYLKDNKCIKGIHKCSAYDTNGACKTCLSGYKVVNGFCVEKSITGCKTQQAGSCVACFSPFKLSNGICSIDNCQTLGDFGCASCASNYFLKSDGLCYPSDAGCSLYRSGSCIACNTPYHLDNGQCKIDGCTAYTAGVCSSCSSPYKLLNGICRIDNCLKSSNGACKICEANYHIHNGLCLKPLDNCIDSVYEVCRMCAPGFYLGDDTHCHKFANGCVYTNGVCSSCTQPFSYRGTNKSCYIEGCLEYDSKGCTKCINSNFILSDGICRLPLCANIVDNKCKDCVKGYFIRNDQCVAIDQYCLKFGADNSCQECKPGFYLELNGYCKKESPGANYINATIVSCREPFTFNPTSKICVIDGCADYFDGGCKTCPAPYVLDYNNCKLPNCTRAQNGVCIQCDQKFVPVKGVCKTKDPYCSVYGSDGVCQTCIKDFLLTSLKTCIRKVAGCIYTGQKCTSCYSPFVFGNGTCNIEGCQQTNDKGCAECKYPYEIDCNGVCVIPNCLQTKNGQCVKCNTGFHAKKAVCESNDPNCFSYADNGNCEECVKGFAVLDDGNCHLRDLHCLRFDISGNCLACDADYYINKYQTCSVRLEGCKTYNGGVCTQCLDRYYLWNNLCRPFRKGCAAYTGDQCTSCLTGYKLDATRNICLSQVGLVTYNDIDMDSEFEGTFNELGFKTITKTVSQTSLTSISSVATLTYSSIWDATFVNPQIDESGLPCKPSGGWKARTAAAGQWVGYKVNPARTFYQVVLQSGADGAYLKTIDIEYTLDGTTYKRLGEKFDVSSSATGTATINFKALYAIEIRIIALEFATWPSCRFEFFASKANQTIDQSAISTTEIGTFIASNVESKFNLQANTNIMNFFNPARDCSAIETCWAGMEFCEAKTVKALHLQSNSTSKGSIDSYYVDYSADGSTFVCYNGCKPTNERDLVFLTPVRSTKMRIHPTKWTGSPEIKFTFDFI